ncbi:hypothetical protein ACW9KT_19685 [Hymenobacter sp. HD11105]
MLKGYYLTLLLGPGHLLPPAASPAALEAFTEATVTTRDDGTSAFQLSFQISNRSPLHTSFLLAGQTVHFHYRVLVIVTLNGTPTVLMDGIVTHHEIKPDASSGQSLVTISGEDLLVLLDKKDNSGKSFKATAREARVGQLIRKYAEYGIEPFVMASPLVDVSNANHRIPSQQGTDRAYIKSLAEEVGYDFYLSYGPTPGQSVAYWGPRPTGVSPQPPLNINMDAHTNVESLSFGFDNDQKATLVTYTYDEQTKDIQVEPITPDTSLTPALGTLPPNATRSRPVSDELAKYSLAKAQMIGRAKAARQAEVIGGQGELNVLRYGRILQARQPVGVRGAGSSFDGLYYVKSVTHTLRRGSYKQTFDLTRSELGTSTPGVTA